jgi:predicted nucleic acid-binding protein
VPLVLDTGPVLALLDADDRHHAACLAMVRNVREDLVVPAPVLVELDYWILKRLGPAVWQVFVEDVVEGGYRLHHLDEKDLVRVAELERAYAELDLGFVDASVIVTCERLRETKVATLDRRDFAAVRPAHCEALTLLPE